MSVLNLTAFSSKSIFSIQKLLPIPLIFISTTSLCQIFGSVEAGLRSDSQDKDLVLRQLGFLNYQDINQQTEAVFDYIIQEPNLSDSSISQLYLKQNFNNSQLIAGRFNRFDNLGYYTLDGVQYAHNLTQAQINNNISTSWLKAPKQITLSSYAGRPNRTDDIHMLSGDYVVGLNSHFRWVLPNLTSAETTNNSTGFEPKLTSMPNDISAHIGYQALKINQASQRLNLGASAKSKQGFLTNKFTGNFRQEFNFSSSLATKDNNWTNSEFEDLTIDTRLYLSNSNSQATDFLQLQYQYYNPELSRPTFKQRFYSTYSIGKIALTELAYHGKLNRKTNYRIAGRHSNKQRGGKGYGFLAQVVQRLDNDWQFEATFDHLSLDTVEISSVYAGISLSPNALSQLKLQTAMQIEEKPLYGRNQMQGLQGSYRYMFTSNLFLSFSLELIRNSQRDNDHLGSFYLVYYFDKEQS